MMDDVLLRHDAPGLCTLTLNRPQQHNALNTALFERLDQELAALEAQQETIGCVLLRATGPSFPAGVDLKALASGATPPPPNFKPGVLERLSRLPQTVVACIHATCVTGGLELVLAADILVAAASARFADTHGRWGLVAGWGMTQRLPRRIGMS
jgi:enoyl-CoA hydratase